jgi:glyoxylase-like metal-dependent hydrolase (beta-lactamase superfamily II)
MAESVREVAPGVFQLRIPIPDNPLGYTLPYLVTGQDGPILIDTGLRSPEGIDALRDQLTGQLGIVPGAVQIILITHNHPDHYGLALEAKKLTGARTAMHRIDWEQNPFRQMAEAGRDERTRSDGMERMRTWFRRHGVPDTEMEGDFMGHRGDRRGERSRREHPEGLPAHGDSAEKGAGEERMQAMRRGHMDMEPPDVLLEGNESFTAGPAKLEAVWTPGHTPGHLCYYDSQNKRIFTGDHILPIITSNVSMRMTSDGDPLGDYLGSVAKVGGLEVSLVLPAHEHHFTDLPGRVAQLQRHHEKRLDNVLDAVSGDRPKTAYEIAASVPWDVGAWKGMDAFLRRAAMGETLSHLEHLAKRGKVRRIRAEDSYLRWTRAG